MLINASFRPAKKKKLEKERKEGGGRWLTRVPIASQSVTHLFEKETENDRVRREGRGLAKDSQRAVARRPALEEEKKREGRSTTALRRKTLLGRGKRRHRGKKGEVGPPSRRGMQDLGKGKGE